MTAAAPAVEALGFPYPDGWRRPWRVTIATLGDQVTVGGRSRSRVLRAVRLDRIDDVARLPRRAEGVGRSRLASFASSCAPMNPQEPEKKVV